MSKKGSYPKNPTYSYNQAPMVPSAPPGAGYYPPPPYTYAAGVPAPSQPYPTANPNMMVTSPGYPQQQVSPQAGYSYGNSNQGPPPAYNPGYPVQQGFNYAQPMVATAHFDSGARFDGVATPNIPPPPPGCAPNAAQMAAAQGGTVVGTKKSSSWITGGTGGGVSFW